MPPKVKICGITEYKSMKAAIDAGADFIGFVFFDKSPRNISIDKAAALIGMLPKDVYSVVLVVNPSKESLRNIIEKVNPDFVQFHGDEAVELLYWVKDNFNIKIIKAISVKERADIKKVDIYKDISDWILFDAKSLDSKLPGGNGVVFDWAILQDIKIEKPWFLAGGLSSDNVAEAIKLVKPHGVDVSSAVEKSLGKKDIDKIYEFIKLSKKV